MGKYQVTTGWTADDGTTILTKGDKYFIPKQKGQEREVKVLYSDRKIALILLPKGYYTFNGSEFKLIRLI